MTDHEYLGKQTVNGSEMKHFSASMDDDIVGEDNQVELEFWINGSGQLTQFQVEESYHYGQEIEVVGVLTQIGESITITEPVVP